MVVTRRLEFPGQELGQPRAREQTLMQDSGPAAGQILAQPAGQEEQVLARRVVGQVQVRMASNRLATVGRILLGWHMVFVALNHLLARRQVEPADAQVRAQRVAEPAAGQTLAQPAGQEEQVLAQRVLEPVVGRVQAQRVLEPVVGRVQENRLLPVASLRLQNRSRSGKSRAKDNILLAEKPNPLLIRERVFLCA